MSKFGRIILFIMSYNTLVEPHRCSRNSDMSACISEPLLYLNGNKEIAADLIVRMAKDLAVSGNRKLNKTIKVPDDMFVTCKGGCATVDICSSTQRTSGESEPKHTSKSEPRVMKQKGSSQNAKLSPYASSLQHLNSLQTPFSTRQPFKKLPLFAATGRFRRFTAATKPRSQCNSMKTTRHRTTKKTTKSCTTKPTCERTKWKRTTKLKCTTKIKGTTKLKNTTKPKCTSRLKGSTKLKGTTKLKCSSTTSNSHCPNVTCEHFGTTVHAKYLQNSRVPPKIEEGTAATTILL